MMYWSAGTLRRVLVYAGGTVLGLAARAWCKDVTESDLVSMASFLTARSAVCMDALVFLGHTQQMSSSALSSTAKSLRSDNLKKIRAEMKSEKRHRREALVEFLKLQRNEYLRGYSTRNKLFEKDASGQALQMQRKDIDRRLRSLQTYSDNAVNQLWEYMGKILRLNSKENNDMWKVYSEGFGRVSSALKSGQSVRRAIEAAEKEFDLQVEKCLTMKSTDPEEFFLERARFNLGGSIISPGLLLQITAPMIDKEKDKHIASLVNTVTAPIFILADKVKGQSPSMVKEEAVAFVKASIGTEKVNDLRQNIDAAYNLRSETICRYTEGKSEAKGIARRIDEIQAKNNERMLKVFELADPAFFKDFLPLKTSTVKDYTTLLINGGGDAQKKRNINNDLGLL